MSGSQRLRFTIESEKCELLLAFERAGSLQELAQMIGRDLSVVSRQLQRLAEDLPVLEKVRGKWQLTALGRQINHWTLGALDTQARIIQQHRNSRLAEWKLPSLTDRTALVIINMQKGFDDPRWGPRNNLHAEANIARLLKLWREKELPVVFIQYQSREPRSLLRAQTVATEIKESVAPRADERVVQKSHNSAFRDTELEETLRAQGLESVILTGMPLDHCVDATARAGAGLEFKVFVVSDATVSFDRVSYDGARIQAEDIHASTLASLHQEFATIIETDPLLALLSEDASPVCASTRSL